MSVTPTSSSSTPQTRLTPQPQASFTSPSPSSSVSSKPAKPNAGQPGNEIKNGKGRAVATNVFSNDGSFLERFQRSKKEEEERRNAEEDLRRKRNFDERFKRRGKRPPPPEEPASSPVDNPPLKKVKGDDEAPLTQYEKELKSYAGRSLKDDGIGVRPLVK